jgi:hypothetical protein
MVCILTQIINNSLELVNIFIINIPLTLICVRAERAVICFSVLLNFLDLYSNIPVYVRAFRNAFVGSL